MLTLSYFSNLKLDLDVYMDAGRAVALGHSPYVEYYIYPPGIAYIFATFMKMGELPFRIFFSILTLFALYYTYKMVGGGRKIQLFIAMGAGVLNIAAMINLIIVSAFKNKNHFFSSLILSAASVIKIYPFLFMPFHFKKHNFNVQCIAGYVIPVAITALTFTRDSFSDFISAVFQNHGAVLIWIIQSVPTYIQYYFGKNLFNMFLAVFLFAYASVIYSVIRSRMSWAEGLGVAAILYAFLFPYSEGFHMQVLLVPLMFGLTQYRKVGAYAVFQITGYIFALAAYKHGISSAVYIFHAFNAVSLIVLLSIMKVSFSWTLIPREMLQPLLNWAGGMPFSRFAGNINRSFDRIEVMRDEYMEKVKQKISRKRR